MNRAFSAGLCACVGIPGALPRALPQALMKQRRWRRRDATPRRAEAAWLALDKIRRWLNASHNRLAVPCAAKLPPL
jgi:hypothetical protein